jgi:hypothetical protein
MYAAILALGAVCYGVALPNGLWGPATAVLPLFLAVFALVASMYGGGFAAVPAWLADLFGTKQVGAIHGRLLTAWSTAGVLGPLLVAYVRDARLAEGALRETVYGPIFVMLGGLLALGLIAALLVRPVAANKWVIDDEARPEVAVAASASLAAPMWGLRLAAWGAVLMPLAWGGWFTVQKAAILLS